MGKIRDLAEDVLSSDVKDALIGAGIVVVDGLADVSDRIAGQMKKQSGNKGNKLYDKFDKYAKCRCQCGVFSRRRRHLQTQYRLLETLAENVR